MTRNMLMLLGLAVALSSSPALAANLANASGTQTCTGDGTWHFVNNQTGGAPAGTLNATWSSGDTCSTGPSKVLSHVQHFICVGDGGTLQTASTNLPGRLVLSDFTCDTKCEPKAEICDNKVDDDCDGLIDADDSDCKR